MTIVMGRAGHTAACRIGVATPTPIAMTPRKVRLFTIFVSFYSCRSALELARKEHWRHPRHSRFKHPMCIPRLMKGKGFDSIQNKNPLPHGIKNRLCRDLQVMRRSDVRGQRRPRYKQRSPMQLFQREFFDDPRRRSAIDGMSSSTQSLKRLLEGAAPHGVVDHIDTSTVGPGHGLFDKVLAGTIHHQFASGPLGHRHFHSAADCTDNPHIPCRQPAAEQLPQPARCGVNKHLISWRHRVVQKRQVVDRETTNKDGRELHGIEVFRCPQHPVSARARQFGVCAAACHVDHVIARTQVLYLTAHALHSAHTQATGDEWGNRLARVRSATPVIYIEHVHPNRGVAYHDLIVKRHWVIKFLQSQHIRIARRMHHDCLQSQLHFV